MKEECVLRFRSYAPVLPGIPYARHTPQVGSSTNSPSHNSSTGTSSNVKILAVLCSKAGSRATHGGSMKRAREDDGSDSVACAPTTGAQEDKNVVCNQKDESAPKRSVYVRVQYDRTLIETLPLEIMREKHPQVLIDYLLSTSVWS